MAASAASFSLLLCGKLDFPWDLFLEIFPVPPSHPRPNQRKTDFQRIPTLRAVGITHIFPTMRL
jgi:hypothetical protein